jgi:1-deoxy-D-xylulose-5-phosphate reductoisomerase
MVEFTDGAVIAQLSMPDMRLPIAYALSYPERATVPFGTIDWKTLARLDFEAPDTQTFPCLNLAFAAGRVGGTAPAWLSAANEVAVEAFLNGSIMWSRIAEVIDATMQHHDGLVPSIVEDILHADALARRFAVQELSQ